MTESDWIELSAVAQPFALASHVPSVLDDVLAPCNWDTPTLHALTLPAREVATRELAWQLALPWWKGERGYFTVTPNEIRANPTLHARHWQRVLDADPSFPIDVVVRRGRLVILDGLHRLLRAELDGRTHVQIRELDREAMRALAQPRS